MKQQRHQFYTWLSHKSAQRKQQGHLALYGSHMVANLEKGLDFYFTTKQTIMPFGKQNNLANNNQQNSH